MTKQAPEENPLKFHLAVEEMNKVGDADALVVCSTQVSSELEEKTKVVPVRNELKSEKNRLGKIVPELYDLEDCAESEKPVKIDLDVDLYQMEKV